MLKLHKNVFSGKLIVFEGTDGAGKTTLIRMTYEYLVARFGNGCALVQKQPTDFVRNSFLFQRMMYEKEPKNVSYRAVQLLTLSDRVQHNAEVVIPALKAGKYVICDRYLYTSVVNMLARGYTHEKWFFQACREIVKPDLAFLAYIEPKIAIERIENRPEEKDRYLNRELLKKTAKNFLRCADRFGLKKLDTSRNAAETFCEVKAALNRLIGEKGCKQQI